MKKKYFQVSLYILVPFILSGLSLLWVILTGRIAYEQGAKVSDTSLFIYWEMLVFTISFMISLFIIWLLLRPVTNFIKKAEKLPVFPKSPKKSDNDTKDTLEHFTQVFDQIANILSKVEAEEMFPKIIGQSKVMRGVFTQLLKVAPTDTTVLILGESGTGKELLAESIFDHSLRRNGPFVKINCVAIPENLLESELFGYEKGAFTGATSRKIGKFEIADGGTIFLDEIGDMPLSTQAKILRILQEKELQRVGSSKTIKVDIRFIAATNKDLPEMVKQGLFREDLYYRINVFFIQLPPLRERKEDIPYLAEKFLKQNFKSVTLSERALQIITAYNWPGNIRELKNTLERADVLTETDVIEPMHLPSHITKDISASKIINELPDNISIDDRLCEIEKGLIIEAINRTGGVQVKAAQLLGINQRSLWHRIKKYEIDVAALKQSTKNVD
ncbi:sigma-54 interaction domain-containing protein [Desulfobacterium sp. N47]|uniref:Acetoacetate metabolism regulatory protein atoC n=1 Tax=uncultured Desulfobacterium sp. TaxID=201089 RepID=E1YCT7_9BACT|nr:Acetoacetate metabolism regulatory protein atoC [uncultured Desulfobacterium sp.]